MSDIVLGIDLGTTNSVVSVADGTQVRVLSDEGGHRLVPSVVSFHPEKRVLVGDEARSRRLIDAKNTIYSVKRLIGRPFKSPEVQRAQQRFAFELRESPNGGVLVVARGETYTLTEISAFVLREVRRVAEQALGQVVTRAVITVPAAFNELQRSATKAAGRVAGLDVLRIVNEPTAAALAYGLGRDKPERIAVYDLGGGTFDLTLLELDKDVFEVLGTAGDSFLGGDDIDVVIAEMMADDFLKAHRWDPRQDEQAFERLRAAGEWAKCKLSSAERAELTIEELTYGPNGAALNLEWTCTREALEERIMPIAARSFEVCKEALRDAGMAAGDVDSVILVGGSTRIPLVRRMVESFFGKAPRTDIDPDLVVAQGAAIHGFTVSGAQKKPQGALGRVALRKATLAEVKAVQEQRAATRAEGPKQPAFAPTNQIDLPAAPKPAYHPPSPASMGRGPKQTVVGVGASAPIVPPVVAPMAESLDLAPTPKPSGKKLSLGKKAQPSAPSPFDLDAAFGAPKPSSGASHEPSGLLTLDEPGALEPSFAAPLPRSDAPKKRPATLMGVGAGHRYRLAMGHARREGHAPEPCRAPERARARARRRRAHRRGRAHRGTRRGHARVVLAACAGIGDRTAGSRGRCRSDAPTDAADRSRDDAERGHPGERALRRARARRHELGRRRAPGHAGSAARHARHARARVRVPWRDGAAGLVDGGAERTDPDGRHAALARCGDRERVLSAPRSGATRPSRANRRERSRRAWTTRPRSPFASARASHA
jgi:molecular chaperone DnaK